MKTFAAIVLTTLAVIGIVLLVDKVEIPKTEDTIPAATGHVNDYAEIIGPEAEAALEADLKNFQPEIAVLTVKDMGGLSIDEYSIKVAEAWKVGDADKDDGIILIVSTGDRKVRIEVGYGSEAKINDSKAGRILDESVVPNFKNSDWERGILEGVAAIKGALK